MGKMVFSVLDSTGHTNTEYDTADEAAMAEAKALFERLTGAGHRYAAFQTKLGAADQPAELVKNFTPAEGTETIFVAKLVGG
jgi:hypothetical protein